MTMRPQGKSLREIRTYVDDTFADTGPGPTDTPMPPEGL
jgi:hypothetical protein